MPAPAMLPADACSTEDAVLSQWLFAEDELDQTPSVLAGLTPVQERTNRAKGINFIIQAGIMLKLPQITLSTASVYLHRFFMRHPMVADKQAPQRQFHHYYSVAAACLFLATKVEENCRKMKELVVACVRVAQKDASKVVDEQDKEFWRWRDTILQLEDTLLETLCFDLSLEQPYKVLFDFLKRFDVQDNKPLRNAAWSYLNDSFLTPACLVWPSRTLAASALYAAARHTEVSLLDDPLGHPWWEAVDVPLKSIRQATNFVAGLYENVPLRGSSEEGLYQRTPEEGDEREAKTRLRRPSAEVEANRKEEEEKQQQQQRELEEKQHELEANGTEPPTKKQKVAGSTNGSTETLGNGPEAEVPENVSEEGEVED